ncbi:rna-directed dna polymerase from mobile element jockey-like [Pitangus sulphuratus]|nr:rna-directed dna polymerase from mobile element jockey-like [Pitangus sulphuratus]
MYTNARSMGNKQEEMEAIVQQESCAVVTVMEMWWDDSRDWSAAMDGYKPFRKDRGSRRGGEVAQYLRESLDSEVSDDKVECLGVRIREKADKADILVGVCYRPPTRMKTWMNYKMLAIILEGGFNLPDVCWELKTVEKRQSRRFLEYMDDSFLSQLSRITGVVPDDWKFAIVTPIHKKSWKEDPGNYRPVSYQALSDQQGYETDHLEWDHTARTGQPRDQTQPAWIYRCRSRLTNLVSFHDQVIHTVDDGKAVGVVYLDFSKAFDTISHSIFLEKLAAHGLDRCDLGWLKNWRAGRTQRMVVSGVTSNW